MRKAYISEIDQFLKAYDQEHPEKSVSQQMEIAQYARIADLRDHVKPNPKTTHVDDRWKDF